MPSAADERVAAVRAFNRYYTSRIGVLRQGLLGTRWSLGEARVIYELGRRDVTAVADLRRELEIDAGFLSRLLGRLEQDGIVRREPAASDRRRQVARLTARGRRAFATLDARSAKDIRALLEDAGGDGRQRRLVAAMATIHGILGDGSSPTEPLIRRLRPGDLGWIVERHGALYAEEYGWDESFEALVAGIIADYARNNEPEREAVWIAELGGAPAGCVMCVRRKRDVAQLRLLLVEPWARRHGIGARLIDECLEFARAAGYKRMMLWTNDPLVAARRLYERAGFELTSEGPHHSFGHDLFEQTWERDL